MFVSLYVAVAANLVDISLHTASILKSKSLRGAEYFIKKMYARQL